MYTDSVYSTWYTKHIKVNIFFNIKQQRRKQF